MKARLKAGRFERTSNECLGGSMATARLSYSGYASGEATTRESNIAERVVMMCASALFSGLTWNECAEIASCARARTFARDELLFAQGQSARNLVMIQTGSVKLSQLSPNGNEVILRMSGSGDPVGMPADSASCSHSCSARAMEQCHALVWEYSRLQALLAQYPQIGRNVSQILSNQLTELQERFREVATEKVAQRVALALLRLVKQVGKPAKRGVEVSLSREELAQMTGTTLFTISRLLSKWGEEGFVLPKREAVVVLDSRRLGQVSEGDDEGTSESARPSPMLVAKRTPSFAV
jgi:CRP-like cAMP-binding protein